MKEAARAAGVGERSGVTSSCAPRRPARRSRGPSLSKLEAALEEQVQQVLVAPHLERLPVGLEQGGGCSGQAEPGAQTVEVAVHERRQVPASMVGLAAEEDHQLARHAEGLHHLLGDAERVGRGARLRLGGHDPSLISRQSNGYLAGEVERGPPPQHRGDGREAHPRASRPTGVSKRAAGPARRAAQDAVVDCPGLTLRGEMD